MRTNKIFRQISAAGFLIIIAGCGGMRNVIKQATPKIDYWAIRREKIPAEKKNKITKTLYSVLLKARNSPTMDAFGIGTMKESIMILDNPHDAAPAIVSAIEEKGIWKKFAGEKAYWKFKFWCVDIAGYLKEKKIASLLYEIADDKTEKKEIRNRAIISLSQMKQKNFLRKLFETTHEDYLREEIARAILKISR
ncbi:MAG: HEAT repeat domain-containing protein [Elusimicrobia bacterium]|nr:HEAT repeat domain-containing protein [Elusimicrobiota bacterium]